MQLATYLRGILAGIAMAATLGFSSNSSAQGPARYDFPAAAQEITQLFWLAATAGACGWATLEEVQKFELFAVRFLTAHLEGVHKAAMQAMVGKDGYQGSVHRVAVEQAAETCKQTRWQAVWVAYKTAADENDGNY
jgi:hypothetical protein